MTTLVPTQASGKDVEFLSALACDAAPVRRQLRSAVDVRVGKANNGGVKKWKVKTRTITSECPAPGEIETGGSALTTSRT